MKVKLLMAGTVIALLSANLVYAHEGMDHDEMMEEKGSMMEGMDHEDMMEGKGSMMDEEDEDKTDIPNVGNKICPLSGEVIAEVGDGKGIQIEHKGKIYNLCCTMCIKDFKKDPDKYIRKIHQELESSGETVHSDAGEDHSNHEH